MKRLKIRQKNCGELGKISPMSYWGLFRATQESANSAMRHQKMVEERKQILTFFRITSLHYSLCWLKTKQHMMSQAKFVLWL